MKVTVKKVKYEFGLMKMNTTMMASKKLSSTKTTMGMVWMMT